MWYDEYIAQELPEPVKMWFDSPEGKLFVDLFHKDSYDEGFENGVHFQSLDEEESEENDD